MRGLFLFPRTPYLECDPLAYGMETTMPPRHFILMLVAVIAAAGLTVWFISSVGTSVMVIALPAFLIAALALRVLRK